MKLFKHKYFYKGFVSFIFFLCSISIASSQTFRRLNNTFPGDQQTQPVTWSINAENNGENSGIIKISAKVSPGIHFYSFAPEGGINGLEITPESTETGIEFGEIQPSLTPIKEYVAVMDETLSFWDKNVNFCIPYHLNKATTFPVSVKIRYQACNESSCFAPVKELLTIDLTGTKNEVTAIEKTTPSMEASIETSHQNQSVIEDINADSLIEANYSHLETSNIQDDNSTINQNENAHLNWWKPVSAFAETETGSPWSILILGFLGGLAALLTPCVWPMIPMTLSFFMKKGKSKRKSRVDAIIYGVSIIVIYLILGLAITAIFGAGKLNELSTNAIFNIFFFLLLVVFAISFFGAFDIKLPARWSNAIDSKAETTTGYISIFFMAFTLALVSFSCTGPIIGTLLVEAASQGNIVGPALGMGGFALGLALPFSLFAIFPGVLKEMPKSGGWLNTVKVVLGFIELILSLKFLSVADMAYQWHILDREVFLVLWIVLFVMLGFYLLGKIRFAHDDKTERVGIFRFFLSIISFSFAVYLLPGLWGAPLKAASAFIPPLETQDFNLYVHPHNYIEFDNYDEGMQYALDNNMPVLLDFSGYGCVNCRNMEAEVFDNNDVREFLAENFVIIKLMVDDRTSLKQPYSVDYNGKQVLIETEGERWTYLQNYKFGASSQPYYIVLNNEGEPMNQPIYYTNDKSKFILWAESGLKRYEAQ